MSPPPIPAQGAYLGAWINPQHQHGGPAAAELQQLGQLQQALGTRLAVLHVYLGFGSSPPLDVLQQMAANGSVPLVDWACAPDSEVVAGGLDQTITAFAAALKSFDRPVFLRYGWEMNLNSGTNAGCVGGDPASFGAAWRHIRALFAAAGATNVAFVWCPGVGGHRDFQAYYPGDQAVDWIAVDGYDRTGSGAAAVNQVFGNFYREFAGTGKPMMIAETGAMAGDQAAYIQGLADQLPADYPDIKALVWFDAPGPNGNWTLQGSGLQAFAALASSPYFSFRA